MDQPTPAFRPTGVVVGDDGSANARAAVEFAAAEATRRGAPLHVVTGFSLVSAVAPDVPFGYVANEEELRDAVLADMRSRWSALEAPSVELHALPGSAAELLISAGETADVVVVGARGIGGFSALLLGSVADKVARHCPCPVTLVKA